MCGLGFELGDRAVDGMVLVNWKLLVLVLGNLMMRRRDRKLDGIHFISLGEKVEMPKSCEDRSYPDY